MTVIEIHFYFVASDVFARNYQYLMQLCPSHFYTNTLGGSYFDLYKAESVKIFTCSVTKLVVSLSILDHDVRDLLILHLCGMYIFIF